MEYLKEEGIRMTEEQKPDLTSSKEAVNSAPQKFLIKKKDNKTKD